MLTSQETAIAEARANGVPYRQIETMTGLDHSTIHHHAQKPTVKAQIERINNRIMTEAAETAADNIIHAVKQYKQGAVIKALTKSGEAIDLPDSQLREHGFKSSNNLLMAMGIFPSHSPTIMIGSLTANTIINNDVNGILDKLYGQTEVIEVEDRPCEIRYEEAEVLPSEA